MEGFLMKRGKEDNRYQLRKFVLNESEDTLKWAENLMNFVKVGVELFLKTKCFVW